MWYVPVGALLALGLLPDAGSASIPTPKTMPRSGGVPGSPSGEPGTPLLVMSALPARPTLEPRKPVRLWRAGGGRQAPRVSVPCRPPLAHHLCSRWGRGAQVGDAPAPPALPDAANLSRGGSGPPTSRRIHPHTCSARPERCPQDVFARHCPCRPGLPPPVEQGDGTCTGPRAGGRQRRRAEGVAVLSRLVVLLRGEHPRRAQWQGGAYQPRRVSPPLATVPTGALCSKSVARSAHSPGRSNGQGLPSCHTPLWRAWQIRSDCLNTGQSLTQKGGGMGNVLQYPCR
jgi:hypothetical protein